MRPKRPRLAILYRKAVVGGAERQLALLATELSRWGEDVCMVSFYDGGEFAPAVRDSGAMHVSLAKHGRWDIPGFLVRLFRTVRALSPAVVYGYQGVANELAWLAARQTGAKVVWGLRASNIDFAKYDWLSRSVFRVGARLSRYSDSIIVNSLAGADHYAQAGYDRSKMVIIPNGIDVLRFSPRSAVRSQVRSSWGVSDNRLVVGVVARLDPMKGHETFLDAAAMLRYRMPSVMFVCAGAGSKAYESQLKARARDLGLEDRIRWLGGSEDANAVINGLDILCSPSDFGEGFSNSIGEAMACEVPCVVCDVGDSAHIIGDTGLVVNAGDPAMLADSLASLLEAPKEFRQSLGKRARERVTREFSVEQMVERTRRVLYSVLN